jgi:hypothetical protein
MGSGVVSDTFGIDRLRTGYRRLEHSTMHEHQTVLGTLRHDHSAGATKHWHQAGSGAPEFGPEPEPEKMPETQRLLLEVRTCGRCQQPVIYWGGDFKHLSAACP